MAVLAPKEISRDTVKAFMRRGGQLVEVLPREEYERVHLAGAVNLPLTLIDRTAADRLKWNQPVIVYSHDALDDTSARAAWRLAGMGFTQVFRYTEGKAEWLANGLPAEGTEARAFGAGDLADMDVPTCKPSDRVGEIARRVRAEGQNVCVVINDEMVALGLLRANALEKANPSWTAEEAMEREPPTFRLNASLDEVITTMKSRLVDSVLITTTDGKLFGLLSKGMIENSPQGSIS